MERGAEREGVTGEGNRIPVPAARCRGSPKAAEGCRSPNFRRCGVHELDRHAPASSPVIKLPPGTVVVISPEPGH